MWCLVCAFDQFFRCLPLIPLQIRGYENKATFTGYILEIRAKIRRLLSHENKIRQKRGEPEMRQIGRAVRREIMDAISVKLQLKFCNPFEMRRNESVMWRMVRNSR